MDIGSADHFDGTDRYVIQRRLGRGGFGVVYQAFDRDQNTVVAVKMLHRSGGDALFQFKHEFRGLADISHPNLVALHDLVSNGQCWFFTMELVAGVDFMTYVARPSTPSETETHTVPPGLTETILDPAAAGGSRRVSRGAEAGPCRCDPVRLRSAVRQLADGLCALHRANTLHRDIKPSNVLVTKEGRVVILDFGLIADLSTEGSGTERVGTPAYMSPEQSAGFPAAQAADWYAVGVMMFEALTGSRPFEGTASEILARKQKFDPPDPAGLATGVPEDLRSLCLDLLSRDPLLRPSGEEVLRLLGAPPVAGADQPARTRFVGRERELAGLRDALEAVRRGRTVAALLNGASGIGKSALAGRFLDAVRQEPDTIVLAGRCYERESVPYKAFDGMIDTLVRYLRSIPPDALAELLPRGFHALSRVFPVLREMETVGETAPRDAAITDPKELRRRAFGALRELFMRLAQRLSLVLFIDDLQWGDADSAALLSDMVQPAGAPRLLLIGAYRTEGAEASPLLRALLESKVEVRNLALEGLPPEQAQKLAMEAAGGREDLDPARAAAIAADSAGNPLFISELVRWPGQQAGAPALDEMIRSRVAHLPDGARRLLEVVAVAGQPIELAVAKQAAGHEGADYEIMALLRRGHLARTVSAGERQEIETYHDRIRETVNSHLPEAALKECHGRLALALESSDRPDAERLAIHFHGAGNRGKAFRYAAAGADQAADALAFDRAARLYRLALEQQSTDDTGQRGLLGRLGDALSNAARGADAADAYLAAANGAPSGEGLEWRRRAASQLLMSGHMERGVDILREVLQASGMRLAATPWSALVSILMRRTRIRLRGLDFRETAAAGIPAGTLMRIDTCWSVAQGLGMVDTIRAADFQTRHILEALRAGEPYRVSRALAAEASYHALSGGPAHARTERILRANHELAERIQNQHPHALGLATLVEGVAAFLEGRWADARDLHARAEDILRERCRGVAWELATARLMWSVALFFLGDLAALADRLPGLLKEAEARGDWYEATDVRIRISHAVWLAGDDPAAARAEVAAALQHWTSDGFFVQHWWSLIANTEISLYSGDAAAAWERITGEWNSLKQSFLLRMQYVRLDSLYHRGAAALAVAAGDVPEARKRQLLRVAEADARRILRERMVWSDPLAQLLRAGVSAARADRERAGRILSEAEAGFERAHMGLYKAAAHRRRGELAGGAEGRRLIDAADEWMAGQRIRNPARMTAMLAPGDWGPRA